MKRKKTSTLIEIEFKIESGDDLRLYCLAGKGACFRLMLARNADWLQHSSDAMQP